jgi:transposase
VRVDVEDLIVELRAALAERDAVIAAQAELIAALRSEVAELKAQLGRDSGNSSSPPSRDRVDRRVRRAQEREARKTTRDGDGPARRPGKQPGTPGATLQRRTPDRTVTHRATACGSCGHDLADAPIVASARRQVIDIPVPRAVVTDHVIERCRCRCGHETAGVFPPEATGPTCWGPRAKAVAAYLMAAQHIPLERASEAMRVLFDAPIGEGTLAGILPDAAVRLDPFLDEIAVQLAECPVVHADETSIRVATRLGWIHTISTPWLTMLGFHTGRGIDAIIDIGVLNHYTGTIVHDGLNVYDRAELANASHAQCGAHLLRHLGDVGTVWKHTAWTTTMRRVLLDAKQASEHAADAGLDTVPGDIAELIRARYNQAIADAYTAIPPGPPPRRRNRGGWTHYDRDAWNLACRFRDQHDQILRLLVDTRVRFDNNEAERSLRMAKLHDKIAGAFRQASHAEAFCTVRSYIQTGRKHAVDTLDNLTRLWTGHPWLPPNVT